MDEEAGARPRLAEIRMTQITLPLGGPNIASEPKTAQQAYRVALGLWASGDQAAAEYVLEPYRRRFPSDIRLAFFQAACIRSRFEVNDAAPLFSSIVQAAPSSLEGQCSVSMLALDRRQDVAANFRALEALASAHYTDPLLLWMLAVACRTYGRNPEGIYWYSLLLKEINGVGPVLVHQTLANLLDGSGRPDLALPHRFIAVRLEPEYWTYGSLMQTLMQMQRVGDAIVVGKKATSLFPDNAWLRLIFAQAIYERGDFQEAGRQLQVSTKLDPSKAFAWILWGDCMAGQQQYGAAMQMYRMALRCDPSNAEAANKASVMQQAVSRGHR
jgi:predicted Zn-dependent protease